MEKHSVTCTLLRSTLVAGETLEGVVDFAFSDSSGSNASIIKAVVHAHGHAKVDPRWISLPSPLCKLYGQSPPPPHSEALLVKYPDLEDTNVAYTFGTRPLTLVLGQNLSKESSTSFHFTVPLPRGLVPSFKGVGCRYFYYVTIRISRARAPAVASRRSSHGAEEGPRAYGKKTVVEVKDIHVPFVVLSSGTCAHEGPRSMFVAAPEWSSLQTSTIDAEATRLPSGRKAQKNEHGDSDDHYHEALVSEMQTSKWNFQRGRHVLEGGKTRSASSGFGAWDEEKVLLDNSPRRDGSCDAHVFRIGNGDQHVAKLVLYGQEFGPGDAILGNFDFTLADTRCHQICACLQMEEVSLPLPADPTAASGSVDAALSMRTDLVSVRWEICFEFAVTAAPSTSEQVGSGLVAPSSVLRWSAPVEVVPPQPRSRRRGSSVFCGVKGRSTQF